jgi:ribosome-binding protein aMBF1 (putative translation factor)
MVKAAKDSVGTRRTQRVARYPKLQAQREALGWSIQELIAKLQGSSVSERSIRRLEQGLPIRATSAHKVFNAIAAHFPEKLIRDEQIKVVR